MLRECRARGTPVGLCCIAPVLAAKVFAGEGVRLTVGGEDEDGGKWPYAGTAAQLKALGAAHVATGADGCVVDGAHGLVTAPAYMHAGAPHEAFDSVGRMVAATLALARK